MTAAAGVTRKKDLAQKRDAQIAALDALIAHMHEGLLGETDDGSVTVVNGAFCRLFGIAAPAAVGGRRRSLLPVIANLVASPKPWPPRSQPTGESGTLELTLTDGRVLEHQSFPVRLADGRTMHMLQFRDVTARRQAEAELVSSRHRLRDLSSHLQGAREEERRELARTLHDELGQLLTGVRLEVASAIDKFEPTPTSTAFDVIDRLQAAVGLVDLSIATVRRITSALRPPMLDHLGLVTTIRWEAALFERRTGIRCRVTASPASFETREHVTVLYRILLEALTNVARHANAGTVWIRVRHRQNRLTMEVRDNGRGISDDAVANPTTLGMLGMRERALAAGGELRVGRLPAGGTSVVVSVPLEAPSDPGQSDA